MNRKAITEETLFLFMLVAAVMVGYFFFSVNQAHSLDSGNLLEILSKDTVYLIGTALDAPANVQIIYPRSVASFDFVFGKGWVFVKNRVGTGNNTANLTYVGDASVPVTAGKFGSNIIFAKNYDKLAINGIEDTSMLRLSCQKPQPGKKIGEAKLIIDPGHGGADKGNANSADTSMYESERAFTLADHIRQNAPFYTAGLTRERNQEKSNEDRLKLIGADTDFVLSIHIGSDMDRAKNYAIAYVPFDSRESASAACYILNEIATKLPEITAVAIIPTDKLDLLGKNTGKVAVMLEIGNIQQPRDSSMLYTKTFKIGDAIVDGIEAYYEGSP